MRLRPHQINPEAGAPTNQLTLDANSIPAWTPAPALISPTLIDNKGDLIVGSANDTVARLPSGTSAQVLTVDAALPLGIGWKDPTGGGGGGGGGGLPAVAPIVRAANAATASASSVAVTIPSATAVGDLLVAFASSGQIPSPTPPAGWQLLNQQAIVQPSGVYENGATYTRVAQAGDAGTSVTFSFGGGALCGASIVAVLGVSAIQEESIRGIGAGTATVLQLASTGGGDGFLTVSFAGARNSTGTTTCSAGSSIATSTIPSGADGCVMTAFAGTGGALAAVVLTHSVTAQAIAGASIKLRGTGGSGNGTLTLDAAAPIPAGTPNGTIIFRRP